MVAPNTRLFCQASEKEIIDNIRGSFFILDPFSGTATTGLVAAKHGLSAIYGCPKVDEVISCTFLSFLRSYKTQVQPEFSTGNGSIDLLIRHANQLFWIRIK